MGKIKNKIIKLLGGYTVAEVLKNKYKGYQEGWDACYDHLTNGTDPDNYEDPDDSGTNY